MDKEVSIGQMAYDFPKISQAAFENYCIILFPTECYSPYALRFHGVMVSTLDFESGDPSSNLGGTLSCVGYFYLVVQIVAKNRKINDVML